MAAVAENLGTYLEGFEKLTKRLGSEPPWLVARRKLAMQRFAELGFPTTHHEEYKYTNLAPIARTEFQAAGVNGVDVSSRQLEAAAFRGLGGSRLIFVNGRFRPDLSQLEAQPQGVKLGGIAAYLGGDHAALESHLTRYAEPQDHALLALNTAYFEDGALIEIPDRVVLDQPIQIVFVTTAHQPNTAAFPRVLILAGRDSQAAVVESYIGLGDHCYWTNAVTEIVVQENARLEHFKVQLEQPEAYHTSVIQTIEERNSTFTSHSLSFGGSLVRNDITVRLDAEGVHCDLNGLFAVNGRQHVDHHTLIDHAKPHCTSHQLYKGVLGGRSTGVFNGKIIVRQDAQKTDAIQNNKNLLLSDEATVNTKPQLEIDANDVRCTHGATVGQLDKEAAFYLRSRGIGKEDARNLLTYAFAADILERVKLNRSGSTSRRCW